MIVWVLTYNDGDYYSTYDMYLSVHASKEEAQDAAKALAENSFAYRTQWYPTQKDQIGEWVKSSVANTYWQGNPEQVEMHFASATWYVFPEEI